MNEAARRRWADPMMMLQLLRAGGRASERKARLLAAAGCRRLWPLLPARNTRKALSAAERYADGQASRKELLDARSRAWGATTSFMERQTRSRRTPAEEESQTHLALVAVAQTTNPWPDALFDLTLPAVREVLRPDEGVLVNLLCDIFGPLPFRQVHIDRSLLDRNDGLVRRLAQAAYDDRHLPEGTLDNSRLAVLADALEEAGLADEEILSHLRGQASHVRGCWVIDLLLGRA
jgi:hypothetical protein